MRGKGARAAESGSAGAVRGRALLGALALALAGGLACGHAGMVGRPTDPAPEEGPLLVLLERGACHGFCPIYWVRVAEDGGVLYEGREFVAVSGRQRAQLGPAALAELQAALAGADFFALDERYVRRDYDGFPRVTTTLRAGGQERTVEHYLGDAGAPARLLELEEAIDRIAGTAGWIGEADRGISGP